MLGSEVPDLGSTACGGCGEGFAADARVVWDPYDRRDPRLAAWPYHARCASGVLPPETPGDAMRACAICRRALSEAELGEAFAALRSRFDAPKAAVATPKVVWRLSQREPERAWLPEHFECLLGMVPRSKDVGGLPGKVVNPDEEGS